MKKKFFAMIGVIVLVFIMIAVLLLLANMKKVAITEIKEFRYRSNSSMMYNGDVVYELQCQDTECFAYYKPSGTDDKDKYKYSVDTEFCEKLEELLEKYDVGSWDGFDKVDRDILDGSSFSLSITMKNGDSINASGYMKYPKHYRDFVVDLAKLYEML